MNIVGRIKLPSSPEISALYLQCNGSAFVSSYETDEEDKKVVLKRGDSVSSSSYFNSFYEGYYAKYTQLQTIHYSLKLEGDFKVSVYRKANDINEPKKIFEGDFSGCEFSTPVQLAPITLLQEDDASRLYLEITCLSEQGIFQEGWISTDEPKAKEVSLGIVICTYKKEDFIKNTLDAILKDETLLEKDFKVFVVDNGKTLEKSDFSDYFTHPKLKLVPNKNAGGSGGFTRGLMEALDENRYSHFLFMDDDIELESESIYKLFSLYEYASSEFVTAGGLLSLNEKHILYEAGATFDEKAETKGALRTLAALNHRLDLRESTSLNQLLTEEEADYGGFWFCAFSKEVVRQLGLPLPLFIKFDDVEYCLRAKKQLQIPIVAFPSMAVWHLAAKEKDVAWETYYYFRNDITVYSIHFTPNYTYVIRNLTQEITGYLLEFDYDRALMLIIAFEDYLKGPDFIKYTEPDTLHVEILKLSRSYGSQSQTNDAADRELLARWFHIAAKSVTAWPSATQAWKNAAKEITSDTFWRQYLDLPERKSEQTAEEMLEKVSEEMAERPREAVVVDS